MDVANDRSTAVEFQTREAAERERRIAEFDRFNATYARFFSKPFPARTTVQSVLWGGILIEIDVVAVRGCARGK